ncbi:MAG: CCA tRNA nucleotidyltransferase [Candidatus Levybacteria bacterium]|nr:CCA tRNA nucleotidyltransferase [Candidatus Levybacteria bacterium]
MIKRIPKELIEVYKKFTENKLEIFFVGGCVRNLLMDIPIKDWDFATNAKPEDILKLFPSGFYDNTFGTVGLPIKVEDKEQVVEVTTFRTEHGYGDKRRPDKVAWGKTIEEDLSRRDFTINAIALSLTTNDQRLTTNLIDPYKGKKDIESKIIKAVGEPDKRFKEDALRLLRAVRIATEISFTIEEKTWSAITADAKLITHISAERIRNELLRILSSDYPYDGVILLRNSALLDHILPELLEGVGVSQARPGRHHTADVFTHNVLSLKFCPSRDSIVRFATLLHDAGKPRVIGKDEQGLVTFYNHEVVGARIVRNICDRLKFSKKDRERIVNLVRWHMFTVDEKITDAAVRRFIRRVGVENVKDIMDLRIGDRLGGGTQTAESWRLKLFKKRIEKQLQPKPFSVEDMAVDGNDVMRELNIKPCPKVGEILQKLFEEVDEDLSKNNREYLIKRMKEISSS